MNVVYQGLFWFGVIYSMAAFVLGHIGHIGGVDAIDTGGELPTEGDIGAHAHGDTDAASSHPSPLKPIIIASFFIVFGSTGMLGEHFGWTFGQALFLSLAMGGLVSTALFKFVIVPLYSLQNTSAATRDELIGLEALVTTPIYENGFGTISYHFKENIYNAPAKSLTGKYIPQGERTVIVKFEGKAFIVHIAEEFSSK